jgi:hypothetical protein
MIQNQTNYESYLLRLWQVRQDGKPIWRASLESTRTGARENFANLQQAFAFLRTALQGEQEKIPSRHKKANAAKRSA